jgi:hypothetical protein
MSPLPMAQPDLVSPEVFGWIITVLTVGLALPWIAVDTIRLRRALADDVSRGPVRDQIFGSIIGLAMGVIGLAGTVIYNLR